MTHEQTPLITQAIPGRIRLRHSQSLTEAALEKMALEVRAITPSATLTYNGQTRCTLILFEEHSQTDLLQALWTAKTPSRPVTSNRQPSSRRLAMRRIKRGMAVSLLTSMGLLILRRENEHGAAGGIFLALLSRHVWEYRKRLWE